MGQYTQLPTLPGLDYSHLDSWDVFQHGPCVQALQRLRVSHMQELQDQPKAIDWDDIQARYFQGHTPKAIATATGVKVNTISVMACRKGWANRLRKAKEAGKAVQISVEQAPDESPKLTAQSERTRTALADLLVRSSETLASLPLLTPARALRVNQDAEAMVRNAAKVFGWSEGQSQPSVRINVMANAVTISEGEAKPVIDVSSTPVSLPPPDC